MTNANRSLLERAAEVYDFTSGLKVVPPPADLPPPRVRRIAPVPLRPSAPPAPAAWPQAAPPEPLVEAPAPRKPVAQPLRPIAHQRVELDRETMTREGLVLPDDPSSALAEEMRLIKRRLLGAVDAAAAKGDARARIVLVASGQPGDGKTFIAANLALSIAGEQDRSVLLVDGDSAKADLPARFGIEERAGFIDAIADHRIDPEALVANTDLPRLSLLGAGRKERNVPELLASARTGDVLARLLAADPTRIILIDSPPALAASSAAVLAAQSGQCLVVVRADATSETDLKETIELLNGCPRVSLVLNSTAFALGGRRFGRYEDYR